MSDHENNQTSERLKLIRAVAGFETAGALAIKLNVGPQRLQAFENGFQLSLNLALQLVELVPGLTLDWLYLGRTNGLSAGLLLQLERQRYRQRRQEQQQRRQRRREGTTA
jgi:hypothetical protein